MTAPTNALEIAQGRLDKTVPPMQGKTLVRIKLDFVIVYADHGIPWISDVTALIVDGLVKTVPGAMHVMPGARLEATDILFRSRLAEERRKAKADKKAAEPKRKAKK